MKAKKIVKLTKNPDFYSAAGQQKSIVHRIVESLERYYCKLIDGFKR